MGAQESNANPPCSWFQVTGFGFDGRQFNTYAEAEAAGLAKCRERFAAGAYPGAFQIEKFTSLSRIA